MAPKHLESETPTLPHRVLAYSRTDEQFCPEFQPWVYREPYTPDLISP